MQIMPMTARRPKKLDDLQQERLPLLPRLPVRGAQRQVAAGGTKSLTLRPRGCRVTRTGSEVSKSGSVTSKKSKARLRRRVEPKFIQISTAGLLPVAARLKQPINICHDA